MFRGNLKITNMVPVITKNVGKHMMTNNLLISIFIAFVVNVKKHLNLNEL